MTALIIAATLSAALFAYELYSHLSRRKFAMLTQDEQAIINTFRGLVAKVESADAALAAANQATADAQAALAAEQADHAELVATLQSITVNIPA